MTRVLVTGATGHLGSLVTDCLSTRGFTVRRMSSQPSQLPPESDREWVQADLTDGTGLAAAVDDVDTIVHAATDPRNSKPVDVGGTRRLLAAAEDADVDYLVYVSIVGIDAWADGWNPYYRHKLAAEDVVDAHDLPTTIQRATQFHAFFDGGFQTLRWAPIWPLPTRWRLQPVAAREVADRLVELVDDPPQDRAPDLGGPETLELAELAAQWQSVRGVRRPTFRLPVPGVVAGRVRDGAMTTDGRRGTETWREWLDRTADSG